MRKKSKSRAGRPASTKMLRVGEEIRQKLTEIIRRTSLDDPALQGQVITVSEVRMSPDLRHATIFASPLGGENIVEITEALRRAAPIFRSQLGRNLKLRHVPELAFQPDQSFAAADEMEQLIAQARARDARIQRDDEEEEIFTQDEKEG